MHNEYGDAPPHVGEWGPYPVINGDATYNPKAYFNLDAVPGAALVLTGEGHTVRYDVPQAQVVDFKDIEEALGGINRWGGQRRFSVLKHLLLCIWIAEALGYREAVPYVAVHDWEEVYTGDIATGMKPYIPGLARLAHGFATACHRKVELEYPVPQRIKAQIKQVDLLALCAEAMALDMNPEVVCRETGYTAVAKYVELVDVADMTPDSWAWRDILAAAKGERA